MIVDNEKLANLTIPQKTEWRIMNPEEYHKDKTAVNFSSLKNMEKSEFSFAKSYWGKPKEATDSMRFGNIVHMAMLEGAKFKDLVVVEPMFTGVTSKGEVTTSKNSKDVKRQLDEWRLSLNPRSIVIAEEEREKIINMTDSLLSNAKAVKILNNSKPEVIGYWHDEEFGINCRFMADLYSESLGILPDLKTTQDARWEYFRKSVESYNYPLQLIMYSKGIKAITGKAPEQKCWITVESQGAHETRIHEVSPIYEATAEFEYRKFMTELKNAIKNKKFEQRGSEVEVGEPSVYYQRKYEFTDLTENL